MKQQLVPALALAVGVLALGPAVAAAETLPPPGVWEGKTSQSVGKTVSYKDRRLRVAVGARGKRFDYVIDKATRCGYARGNRGTTMRCSQLAQKRYLSKPVRVIWRTDAKKRRIAVTLGVILSPSRSRTAGETPPPPGGWNGKTSQSVGKTLSYKNRKLRVAVGARGKRFDYVVDERTSCGYARGNRGTGLRCSQLAEKQYLSKPVRVLWRTDAKKRRIAVVIAVILEPRRGSVVAAARATAQASPSPGVWEGKRSQSAGRTVAYENGRLRVAVGARKKRVDYVVDKATRCSYARGNRSITMTCSQLRRRQYLDKPVRVVWRTDARKRRIALNVGVILSPRRGSAVAAARTTVQTSPPPGGWEGKVSQSLGKTVSYKDRKLRVAVGVRRKRVDYVVARTTDCAYSRGNHGTTIRCADLGQKRYLSKSVRVGWYTDSKRRRVAAFVAVILPKG